MIVPWLGCETIENVRPCPEPGFALSPASWMRVGVLVATDARIGRAIGRRFTGVASALTVRVIACVSKFDGASIVPVPRLTVVADPDDQVDRPGEAGVGRDADDPRGVVDGGRGVLDRREGRPPPAGRAPLDDVGQDIVGVGVDAPELEGGDLVQSDGLILDRLEERTLVDRGGAGGHVHPEGLRGARVGARVDGRHDDVRHVARHRRGRVDVDHAVGVGVGEASPS